MGGRERRGNLFRAVWVWEGLGEAHYFHFFIHEKFLEAEKKNPPEWVASVKNDDLKGKKKRKIILRKKGIDLAAKDRGNPFFFLVYFTQRENRKKGFRERSSMFVNNTTEQLRGAFLP
jgi:hypothetical protein